MHLKGVVLPRILGEKSVQVAGDVHTQIQKSSRTKLYLYVNLRGRSGFLVRLCRFVAQEQFSHKRTRNPERPRRLTYKCNFVQELVRLCMNISTSSLPDTVTKL